MKVLINATPVITAISTDHRTVCWLIKHNQNGANFFETCSKHQIQNELIFFA